MNHQKTLADIQSHRYEVIPSGPIDELPHIIENDKVFLFKLFFLNITLNIYTIPADLT